MRIYVALILYISIVFLCGFMGCESQLIELLPSEIDTPANMVLIPAGEVTIGLSQSQFERHIEQYPPSIPVNLEFFYKTKKNKFTI